MAWGWRPRPWPVRRLSRQPRPEDAAEPESPGPIRFSTSKASPRVWPVERSLGSNFRRPWARVLPVSLLGMGLVLWCFFREETEVDKQLGTLFREHVPELLAETSKSEMLPPAEHENS